jgi:hypothetical protein
LAWWCLVHLTLGIGPKLTVAGGTKPVTYLLRDEFDTAAAAPLASPRTCEPGPGTLTLVQTDGQFSVSGGKLMFPTQATPAWGDLGFRESSGLARQNGRAVICTFNLSTIAASSGSVYGFKAAADLIITTAQEAFSIRGGAFVYWNGTAETDLAQALSTGVNYQFALVSRSAGSFLLVKGGSFTNWALCWVSASASFGTLYAMFNNFANVGTLDSFRVTDLPAPWNNDYGISAARYAGAVSAGQAYTHPQDCLLDFTVTTKPSSGIIVLIFRQQDANNYWSVEINSAGDLLLKETVAGTPTIRSTAAGVVSNGHRCVVISDDIVIRDYSNNVLRTTYSSAANFKTATAGSLSSLGTGGAVSDLTVWPRYPNFPSV